MPSRGGRGSGSQVARPMDEFGRPGDGAPIKPGDVFLTLSGRVTTPYPRQKGIKFKSQWIIENAAAEARERGDDFNASAFGSEKPLTDGTLPAASTQAMLLYLFAWQPDVPNRILKGMSPSLASTFGSMSVFNDEGERA